ncbi:hypothetical protein ACFE04_010522 [Oxalis oulophora]
MNVVGLADSDDLTLLQLKNSVTDQSGLLSNWVQGTNHCSWFGVMCDSNFRVVSLNVSGGGKPNDGDLFSFVCWDRYQFPLYGLGFRRYCDGKAGYLEGKLFPLISKLTELRILSMPYNGLVGEIPEEIWSMGKLEVLDLENNRLTGLLPAQAAGLKNLRFLNLAFNNFSGVIPHWLADRGSLEVLNLSGNKFNGTVPAFVGRSRAVYLSYNCLEGTLPKEIGENCGKLEYLDLSRNYLFGRIPDSLGNCGQLRTMLLFSNLLEEDIPSSLGQLQKLEILDVSKNSLSGPVPRQLGKCTELSVLVLSNMPDTADNSTRTDPSFEEFNYFEGGLPVEITRLPKLRLLWAQRAMLEGKLPGDWGACDNLEMINLSGNFFSGEIPVQLNYCKKLVLLDLSSNKLLSGELSDKLVVPCIVSFDVSGNSLTGSIPSFGNATCPRAASFSNTAYMMDSLSSAYMSCFANKTQVGGFYGLTVMHNFANNNFSGPLPSIQISVDGSGRKIAYEFLAGENKLSGPFPGDLCQHCNSLSAVFVNVSYNRLSDQIPTAIGTMCKPLQFLDASVNLISGPIPPSFGDLLSLIALNLSSNALKGEIPTNLGQIKSLRYLSLAHNNLTGTVPSSLGLLQSLEVLELSSNSLSGEIPKSFVHLRKLDVLELNDNNLSGKFPSGLGNVSSLNISSNNLLGPLPSNNNLMKCSSFLGNPYLRPCHVFSLTTPSADQPVGNSQNYDAPPGETPSNGGRNPGFNSIELASIASASAIVSVLLTLIVLFICTRNWSSKSKINASKKEVTVFTDIGVPLTYETVVRATGNFNARNCIGSGGFGATYKAEISSGNIVAIKRLAVGRFQGIEQFHAEIKTLGRFQHPNLVTLVGYHASESEMFLVYNYLSGGNLEKFIQDRSTRPVDWRVLHKISLDVARALSYLHDQCAPRVLHRDVKPSNILLDKDFNAYLSDFGLARLLGTSETHATTGVAGTFGYVAPEYAMTCRVSDKADVYSYGVVLLELLSDKKALDPSFSSYGNGFNIVTWACLLLRQGKAKEFFTAGLWEAGPHDDLVEVLHLAVVCTVDSLSTRPTMKQVVRRLKQLRPPLYY